MYFIKMSGNGVLFWGYIARRGGGRGRGNKSGGDRRVGCRESLEWKGETHTEKVRDREMARRDV
jgi:hypothetical protein